jgi:N-acetyl-anhydromuramyl-L-alanine amidase AmpD
MKQYNLSANNVIRHSDCSGDHVRGKGKGKVDPGSAFNWELFKKSLVG